MRIVRLGQGVDATGQFAPDALARTKAALVDYADAAAQFRGTQGADGGDVGHPRRRQPRRVLRDDGRRAGCGGAGCGRRSDHRHRGGRVVVPRCGRRIRPRLSTFRGRRPRRRFDRSGAGLARRRRELLRRHRMRAADRALPALRPADRRGDRRRAGSGPRGAGRGAAGGARRAGPHLGRGGGHHDHAVGAGAEDDDLRLGGDPPVPGGVR